MVVRIRTPRQDNEREEGFTLIELLVVIIIIGILAAIAIPVFLNQRSKGYDAQAKNDLRNLATLEETYVVDVPATYGLYNNLTAAPYSYKKSLNVTGHSVVIRGNSGFTLLALSNSGVTWCWSSDGKNALGVAGVPSGLYKSAGTTC